MNKILLLLTLTLFALTSQAQITINSSDIPAPTSGKSIKSFKVYDVTGLNTTPVPTTNGSYVLATKPDTANKFFNTYFGITDTYFTNRGANMGRLKFKYLNSSAGYSVYSGFNLNSKGFDDALTFVTAQKYDISALTMTKGDSLFVGIPGYSIISRPKSPRRIMQFPMTFKSTWKSVYSVQVPMYLKTSTLSFVFYHHYSIHRKDSIIGWGKMQVNTVIGKSKNTDVLIDKITEYAVDSFYDSTNKVALSSAIVTAFGLSQGQMLNGDKNNRYDYLRKGNISYLYSTYYGSDNFTTSANEYEAAEGELVGIEDFESGDATINMYPNPSKGIINLNLESIQNIKLMRIVDITGREVFNSSINNAQLNTISLPENIVNGLYYVSLIDVNGNKVSTKSLILNR